MGLPSSSCCHSHIRSCLTSCFTFHLFVQIDPVGVCPVLFWCFSAFCFALSAGETQVWLGDLRVVALVWLLVLYFASIDLLMSRTVRPCTDVFSCLLTRKDRAISATSAKLEKKKLFHPFFFTTLVPTQRGRYLLRSAWVSVMPEWLLSVISGILAGESPVSALSFVAF